MDSDPLRHLEFFSMPNNQTVNPVDQPFMTSTSAQPPPIWDTTGMGLAGGISMSPSTAPTPLSLDSIAQPSSLTGFNSISPGISSASQASAHSRQPRPVLPARGVRRDAHERKRSRLSMDATPLDSVDYWLDFDKDEGLASIPEGVEASRREGELRPSVKRSSRNTAHAGGRLKHEETMDDSALDNALSDDDDDDDGFSSINLADHMSKIESAPPPEVPPREGLYSTPLSWERPQPGLRMDSLIGLNNQALNEAEQRRLIAIAMNPGSSMGGLGSNLNLNFTGLNPGMSTAFTAGGSGSGSMGMGMGTRMGMGMGVGGGMGGPKPVSPPHSTTPHPKPGSLHQPKRQGSVSDSKAKEKVKAAGGDRTAHNDIERKYRTNLKDKISELRDAVPSLRTIPEHEEGEDPNQPSRAPKVSKGAVLTKATEYIHWLERRNKQIVQEHRELSRRLQAFEQLLNATARPQYMMPTYSRTLFDPRGFC
ncbi:hypothetical protein QC761_407470 [Podospora bellae-mahoneyi]|uniref:BHLH domain-containing protein n=1 Tax=Podospora bellae-mahoneyi TaxID=2093777 RepID=A0ABR0FK80_9PEZI|nr:hypothetical protein QC761_407470 [Podospora bellae-mahoneyi]